MPRLDYDASRRSLVRPDLAEPGGRWSVFLDDPNPSPGLLRAECARLAYVRFEEDAALAVRLHEALARVGLSKVGTFDAVETGSQALAAYDCERRTAIVAFRGTEIDRIRDIAIDLQVSVEAWPTGGRVHRGFATAARQIMPMIQAWLDENAAQRRSLSVTGHSLGAALAVLAASCWRADQVAAFGCPRIGDPDFADSVKDLAIARFRNCCDIACNLPPESPWYTHVGTQSYIDRHGQLVDPIDATAIGIDQAAARSAYLLRHFWQVGTAGARELADHSMLNYLRAFT